MGLFDILKGLEPIINSVIPFTPLAPMMPLIGAGEGIFNAATAGSGQPSGQQSQAYYQQNGYPSGPPGTGGGGGGGFNQAASAAQIAAAAMAAQNAQKKAVADVQAMRDDSLNRATGYGQDALKQYQNFLTQYKDPATQQASPGYLNPASMAYVNSPHIGSVASSGGSVPQLNYGGGGGTPGGGFGQVASMLGGGGAGGPVAPPQYGSPYNMPGASAYNMPGGFGAVASMLPGTQGGGSPQFTQAPQAGGFGTATAMAGGAPAPQPGGFGAAAAGAANPFGGGAQTRFYGGPPQRMLM